MDQQTEKIKKRYNRIAPLYELMERPMEKMALEKWRSTLFENLSGKVLEVGVGTGKNIMYYPPDIRVSVLDFSPKMLEQARKKAKEIGKRVDFHLMDAQKMTFDDNTFDFVITSCVFCSVPDPIAGLREIRRVLKPGGKLLMIEHVRSENKVLGLLMDVMNPMVVGMMGANINRKTVENIKVAGFTEIKVIDLWGDIVKKIEVTNPLTK